MLLILHRQWKQLLLFSVFNRSDTRKCFGIAVVYQYLIITVYKMVKKAVNIGTSVFKVNNLNTQSLILNRNPMSRTVFYHKSKQLFWLPL